MRVLLVEDNETTGEILQDVLQQHGYHCDWHAHGKTGAHAIEHNHYDVVLLNLGLPYLSGKELLALVRAKSPTVPVIMLTAQLWDESRDYLAAGADAYITKPFDLEYLLQTIESLIAGNRQVA